MTQLWSVNFVYTESVNYNFILDVSKILDNIYILLFLVNSINILSSHCAQFCFFVFFVFLVLFAKNPCFVTKNYSKYYISVFILSEKQHKLF